MEPGLAGLPGIHRLKSYIDSAMPRTGPSGDIPRVCRVLWVAFSLFVVYGTTIPFRFDLGEGGLAARLGRILWHPLGMRAGDISTPDLLQNLLLFLPFGFLGYLARVGPSAAPAFRAALATMLGTLLSASVEMLQLFSETRVPALSDVLFNGLGAALGALAASAFESGLERARGRAAFLRLLSAPSAYPALVLLALAAIGSLSPFDFTLDVGEVAADVRALLRDPFAVSLPRDEALCALRVFLATVLVCRLGREAGWPVIAAPLAMAAVAGFLEASQILLSSRTANFQDALSAWLGVAAGVPAAAWRTAERRPGAAAFALITATAVAALMAGLHPFRFQTQPSGFQWMPFLAEYQETSFVALANTLEGALTWFPLGFLLGRWLPSSARPAAIALAASLVLSIGVEAAQPFVAGRYGDITDVIGAVLGSLAGSLVLGRVGLAAREAPVGVSAAAGSAGSGE